MGRGVTVLRISSSSSTRTRIPLASRRRAASRATLLFPLPGSPVSHATHAMAISSSQVAVKIRVIELLDPEHRLRETEELHSDLFRQARIPERAGDHKGPKDVERRDDLLELQILSPLQVIPVEQIEELAKRPLHPTRPHQRKEQVIDAEGRDIIGRLAPLSPAPIEQGEIRPLPKED